MFKALLFAIIVFFCISFPWKINAQISESAVPYSITGNLSPLKDFVKMPVFYDQVLKQDVRSKLKSNRFAKMFDVAYHPYNSGIWEETGEGKVWRLGIYSPEAYSLYLVFRDFNLEPGVKLFVYNADFSGLAGAFSSRNNNDRNILAVAPVPGEKLIIELDIPSGQDYFGNLLLARVGHDYKNEFGRNRLSGLKAAPSGSCNVDINCPAGQPWQNEKRAVCRLVANGELCTGTLINNAESQKVPYLITAFHCIQNESIAEEAVFIFNYENISCGGKIATTPQSLSGSQLIATTQNKLDFSLLKLWEYPPLYYQPFFVGWDARPNQPSNGVCIHHPNGDVTKISIENHPLITANYGEGFDPDSHWLVSHWEVGATEGGSSGSAIFNEEHRVVGTLTGGSASCADPRDDYFTKFTLAWDKYPLPQNQLKNWLDPNNKGVTFMSGMDPYNIKLGVCDTFWNIPMNEHLTVARNGMKWGWISGTNSRGFTQFAERFYSKYLIQVLGVFLYVAKSRPANPFSYLTVKLWEGSQFPETERYSQRFYLRNLEEGKINFAGFDTLLTVAGNFFAGYEISYSTPLDTFAVYQSADRGVTGPSTMYVFDREWKNINAAVSPAVFSSLSIGLISCGGAVESFKSKGITVFPNPCIGIANVDLPEGLTITGIKCFDVIGRNVSLPSQILDGKLIIYPVNLSNGIYMLEVLTTAKPLTTKFQVLKD